ncbi:hypothetical protein D5S17_36075 [Pseudonocardiaceae bacterium YIM PH 21723]|nr:hypothetical protein D5S17_36075 [Pseudonocardiaceae bacterium YIM PH 21723]
MEHETPAQQYLRRWAQAVIDMIILDMINRVLIAVVARQIHAIVQDVMRDLLTTGGCAPPRQPPAAP